MRSLTLGSILVSATLLAGCGSDTILGPVGRVGTPSFEKGESVDATFTYATFDVPGAVSTIASGINARGDIVGTYIDADGRRHGFAQREGIFTTIDYPGAAGTEARGIGPGGEIVGFFWRPGELGAGAGGVSAHGYLLDKQGEFAAVDYFPHANEVLQRILPDGTILGCYHDADLMGSMHGVLIGRHGREALDQSASMNMGATPNGRRITGFFTDMDGLTKAYITEDGTFTAFMVPQSIATQAWDMTPAGEIAGFYRDAAAVLHGFVRLGDHYSTLNVPGASATRALGINASGKVVGNYVMGGLTHAFLATPEE
jgi:uncharacterized membrane protein